MGGMAAVFRARDDGLGRVVALKVLAARDEAIRKRFAREARAVATVDHPHIIPVYAAGEADGCSTSRCGSWPAGTCTRSSAGRARCRPARGGVHLPVASALDAAHADGACAPRRQARQHPGGHAARPAGARLPDRLRRRRHAVVGAPDRARGSSSAPPTTRAPEQISGQPVDGRADQYALACVAYEVLTGSVPFEREDADAGALRARVAYAADADGRAPRPARSPPTRC